jgi:hypothetical protein
MIRVVLGGSLCIIVRYSNLHDSLFAVLLLTGLQVISDIIFTACYCKEIVNFAFLSKIEALHFAQQAVACICLDNFQGQIVLILS